MVQLATIAILLASVGTFVQCKYMGKRDPEREYYTLNIPKDGFESAKHIAQELNVRFEGGIGELDNWFMVSSPKTTKRDEDLILSNFHHYKSLGLNKRQDSPWQKVQSIDKQVLKRRTKRGPIPPTNDVADVQKTLNMTDPWLEKQWHLVSINFSCPLFFYMHINNIFR